MTEVSNPEDYSFVGWKPQPKTISGATKCYAQYSYTGYQYVQFLERKIRGDYVNDRVSKVGDYAFYGMSDMTSAYNKENVFQQKYKKKRRFHIPTLFVKTYTSSVQI